MKKSHFILGIVVLFILSCSPDQSTEEKALLLKSPSGKVLASSASVLKEELLNFANKNTKTKMNAEVLVHDIQYSESEDVSVAIINFSIEDQHYSILTPTFNSEKVMMLKDQQTLRFVKMKSDKIAINGDVLELESKGSENSFQVFQLSNSAECFFKECCKWQIIVDGSEYNCGCKSTTVLTTPSDGITLTTSDGCKIRL